MCEVSVILFRERDRLYVRVDVDIDSERRAETRSRVPYRSRFWRASRNDDSSSLESCLHVQHENHILVERAILLRDTIFRNPNPEFDAVTTRLYISS